MKNPMNRFGPLQLATLLCIIHFGPVFAVERHVPSQYATIQQAINAAVSGDIIRIAPGNYAEALVVQFKTNLTLAGEPGTVLQAFPGMSPTLAAYGWPHYAVCAIYRSDVVLSNLHFKGDSLGDTLPGFLDGAAFHAASGTVTDCTFSGFRAVGSPPSIVARGLFCANLVDAQSGPMTLTISGNTFTNNQVAMRLGGDPFSPEQLRLTVGIHRNTIRGYGPDPGANLGVLLICGVTGDVTHNFFSDFAGTVTPGPDPAITAHDTFAQSRGRFAPLLPFNFEGNTFTNNGQHLILIGANGSRIANNNFLGAVPGVASWGGLQVSGTNVLVANNNFSDMPIGTVLFDGTEPVSPTNSPAANTSLIGNWFCNVPEPIKANPLMTAMQEQGTETNCPFTPRFRSFTRSSNGESLASLRGWPGASYVIETSTNLQHWAPAHTNAMTLPLFEFRDTNAPAHPQRFYRAFKQ